MKRAHLARCEEVNHCPHCVRIHELEQKPKPLDNADTIQLAHLELHHRAAAEQRAKFRNEVRHLQEGEVTIPE